MIFLQKGSSEAAKHPHDAKFILAMRVASTGIKNHVFDGAFAADSSSAFIAAPEIAVHDDRGDALAVVEVLVAYESGYCFFDCLFDQGAEGRVFAVCAFALLEDG